MLQTGVIVGIGVGGKGVLVTIGVAVAVGTGVLVTIGVAVGSGVVWIGVAVAVGERLVDVAVGDAPGGDHQVEVGEGSGVLPGIKVSPGVGLTSDVSSGSVGCSMVAVGT